MKLKQIDIKNKKYAYVKIHCKLGDMTLDVWEDNDSENGIITVCSNEPSKGSNLTELARIPFYWEEYTPNVWERNTPTVLSYEWVDGVHHSDLADIIIKNTQFFVGVLLAVKGWRMANGE